MQKNEYYLNEYYWLQGEIGITKAQNEKHKPSLVTSTQKMSTTCYCTAQLPQTSGICFVVFLVFPGSCLSLLGMLLKAGVHGMLRKPSRTCR
ncbi:hypothetical protein H5410_048430 [Solanum commersonii]|uniref:Uncharacterized protein n=1 Tax=Solanum commersonii TaxID=4109 RepID=A0A9J5XL25_SOLCO|nr:hypothetical protein H5410_048430 [Solanum commersonii]